MIGRSLLMKAEKTMNEDESVYVDVQQQRIHLREMIRFIENGPFAARYQCDAMKEDYRVLSQLPHSLVPMSDFDALKY